MKTASYEPEKEFRGLESEMERLKQQVVLSWEREIRLLKWLGLEDGLKVAELGCGPGYVTAQLLAEFPNLAITALDADAQMIERGQAYVANHPQVQWVTASVQKTGLPSDTFDFAIARYLFQHIPDPLTAVQEILRLLKPGGKLAIIDIDAQLWGIVSPSFPQLQAIYAKSGQASRGGNRLIGRHLWQILKEAGYHNPQLDAFVYHSPEMGLEPFLPQLSPDRLNHALENKQISLDEFTTAHFYYQKFLNAPQPYVLMVGLIASGEKSR